MNYNKIYNDLIKRAVKRKTNKKFTYEKHHILPVCCGGSNDKNNLVNLTYKEHWLAHLMLMRIYKHDYNKYIKLSQAVLLMKRTLRESNRGTGRLYETARKDISQFISKKHKGQLVVKDKDTDEIIGRVDKNHPNVVSGQWIFWQKGVPKSESLKAKIQKAKLNQNPNYSGVSNKELLRYCKETYEEFGILTYKLMREYISTRDNIRVPSQQSGNNKKQAHTFLRFNFNSDNFRSYIHENLEIPLEDMPTRGTWPLNRAFKKIRNTNC